MRMERKSFFSDLRDKQLLESKRKEQRHIPLTTLPITRVPRPPMRNSLNEILDEVDIWSFEGRTGASVNLLAQSEKSPGCNNDNNQDKKDEVRLPVEQNFSTESGSHQWSLGLGIHDTIVAGPSMALSTLSNQFRRFNEGSRLNEVLSKSIPCKTSRLEFDISSRKTKIPEKNLSILPLPPSSEGTSPAVQLRGNENEEINQLESSIIVEDSPVRRVIGRRGRIRPSPSYSSPKILSPDHFPPSQTIRFSESPSPRKKIQVMQSHSQPNGPNFSSQISEIQSSSQSTSFSPVSKTPLSIWIYQDQTEKLNIEEFIDEKDDQESFAGNNLGISTLIENFKTIKARYDTSVRLFAHDLRSGKYDDEKAAHFLIRKIVDRQDKMVMTLAYDLNENRDRWVLFKPTDLNEISEGVSLKIYPPWQEVPIPETNESMFICSDFYKIVRHSDLRLTDERVQEISEVPIPTLCSTRMPDPLFMDMVPFHMKNHHTIHHHTRRFHSRLDISVVILYAWTHCTPAILLLKDSDEFLSFMEVPKTNHDLLSTLQPGKFVQLKQIALVEKVLISKKLAPFSVLYMFGGRQTYFFNLRWTAQSNCQLEEHLDIPMAKMTDEITAIEEIKNAPTFQDHRISLKCKIKDNRADNILVSDEESGSVLIEFISDPSVKMEHVSCDVNAIVILKFLRVIHGKILWDYFTTWELAPDED